MTKLCVITGAGASYDAAGATTASTSLIDQQWRPPLTSGLFSSRRSFDPILRSYPQAHPLIHRIRGWVASESTVSLESRLSQVYRSGNSQDKRQLKYLTYYLRELIQEVSNRYIQGSPSNYDRLIDEIWRRDLEVIFLTLNYDLFLEAALRSYEGVTFNNVQDYFPEGESWRLIKVHGSVNWGRRLLEQPTHLAPDLTRADPESIDETQKSIDALDLESGLDEQILVTPLQRGLLRAKGALLYPAMVIPVEDKYEFVCPAEHVRKAKEFLKTCSNFLVVGCSMKDKDVLDLLSENVSDVRGFLVNGNSKDGCNETQVRIREIPAFSHCDSIYIGGFDKLMISGKLAVFLDSLSE